MENFASKGSAEEIHETVVGDLLVSSSVEGILGLEKAIVPVAI